MIADSASARAERIRATELAGAPEDRARALSLWRTRAAVLIATATLARLLVITTTGLANGEAYYYVWSRFPSWSYYDHPPLVAWMVWLTTRFSDAEVWIRVGPVLCSTAFAVLVYRLAERLFSARAAFVAVAIVTLLPVYFVSSYALNPEAPLAPLWVLFLLILEGMRENDEGWRPIAAGFVAGAAFMAKYSGLLLLGVALAYVVASPRARRWLRRPSLYTGPLVALLVVTPVIAWNQARGWPSLALHFVERRASPEAGSLAHNVATVLLGQLGALHPLVFPGLLFVLAVAVRRAKSDDRFRFLALASGPVLLFFFTAMVSVRDPEPHWTMVGYVPLAIAAGGLLDELGDRPPVAVRWYVGASVASGLLAIVLTYAYSRAPRLRTLLPESMYDPTKDVFNEMTGWDELRGTLHQEVSRLGDGAVVASCQYALCAHLSQTLEEHPPVYCPSERRTEFDFIDRGEPPPSAPVLYVTDDHYHDEASLRLPGRECEPLRAVRVERDGVVMRHYYLEACGPKR